MLANERSCARANTPSTASASPQVHCSTLAVSRPSRRSAATRRYPSINTRGAAPAPPGGATTMQGTIWPQRSMDWAIRATACGSTRRLAAKRRSSWCRSSSRRWLSMDVIAGRAARLPRSRPAGSSPPRQSGSPWRIALRPGVVNTAATGIATAQEPRAKRQQTGTTAPMAVRRRSPGRLGRRCVVVRGRHRAGRQQITRRWRG